MSDNFSLIKNKNKIKSIFLPILFGFFFFLHRLWSLKAEVIGQCRGHQQMSLYTGLIMSLVQEFPNKEIKNYNSETI